MRPSLTHRARIATALAPVLLAACASQQPHGDVVAPEQIVLQQYVAQMPRGASQEIRVIGARYAPGERQYLHTHRFPVTVIVQQGLFTLEMEGRAPIALRAGQSFVEPPGVKMTGHNRGDSELRLLMVYVSDVDAPFVDLVR